MWKYRILECLAVLFVTGALAQTLPSRAASGVGGDSARDGAESPISVGFHREVQISIAGTTAAYSLDSSVAEATGSNGIVRLSGTGPGETNIVVVTASGVQTLSVVVPKPPPSYPPGFVPPSNEGGAAERGSYEIRYSSDPGQLTNSIDLTRTQGGSVNRFQLTSATLFSNSATQTIYGFPLASYQIGRPHYDVTFVDKQVGDAPLTLDGYLVRGLHVQAGDWQFHGGFTSVAVFQGVFLSTDPEYVAGLSRKFSLHKYGSLEGGFYYFQNPHNNVVNSGGLASLTYRLTHADNAKLLVETGASHGTLALAARGDYNDKTSHVAGNFRVVPQRFASLEVNNQHGVFADLNASRNLNSRLFASLNLDQSNFNLPLLRQNTFAGSANVTVKLNRNFSVLSGAAYTGFQARLPVSPSVTSLNLPIGIDYSTRHFGSGFQYQRTDNLGAPGGNDYSFNVRASARQFLASSYYQHDVQAPTVAAVFAQLPGLEQLLQRAGIVITDPDQLFQLLSNSALLATLGFTAPLALNLAPVRNDFDASLSWRSQGQSHSQIGFDYFDSNTQMLQGQFRFTSETVSFSRRILKQNDLISSFSLLHTSTGVGKPQLQPVFSVSLRSHFSHVPSLILPGRHGTLEGHVFRDDDLTARYKPGLGGLAGVEVTLDNDRVTHTDSNGYYVFHHVPFGAHTIEARPESSEPSFHTTDSPALAEINSVIDFGISFAKAQLFGFLLNDAGAGINGVTVELRGANAHLSQQTTQEGKFTFHGLEPGEYVVATVPESYPSGYSLQNLQPQTAKVEIGKADKIEMRIKAIRSVSGKVTAYDRTVLKQVPVAGIAVRIEELGLEAKTGANGAYIFRNLPAGNYTVSVVYEKNEVSRKIIIPTDPVLLRDIDLEAGAK